MLSIKPITEEEADEKTGSLYRDIKNTLQITTVPVVFQYIAPFPQYFNYLWSQAKKNITDGFFQKMSGEIAYFSQEAINQIYYPSNASILLLERITNRPEQAELRNFVTGNIRVQACLYLLSLAIREGIKGKFLGIKQIGEKLEKEESDVFTNIAEGFSSSSIVASDKRKTSINLEYKKQTLQNSASNVIATTWYSEFFKLMDLEMQSLLKKEEYLTRRVELERFSLSKLYLLTYPLESSLATVIRQCSMQKNFPELIYLVAEVFPTQSPYKLMASGIMKKALAWEPEIINSDASANLQIRK